MLSDQENIFDVPHSLPSSAHSIALSTRTPTTINKIQNAKFMPDYGGNLEVPGTQTKHYCFRQGIPFNTNPHYVRVVCANEESRKYTYETANNLIVAAYLNKYREDDTLSYFSVIRALGANLYFNAVRRIPYDPPEIQSSTIYAHIPYIYNITGLKCCDTLDKFLVVKFDRGVKLLRLNRSFQLPPATLNLREKDDEDDNDENEAIEDIADPNQSAFDFVGSFAGRRNFQVRDACLSTNQNILATASSDRKDIDINLYDIAKSKKCYKTLVKTRDDNAQLACRTDHIDMTEGPRRKSLRSYVPVKSSFEELHQIENDPGHLIHMSLTTSNRVAAIDIRSDSIWQDYVNRHKLQSVTPTEIFKQIAYSRRNDQQFYLLSNEKVRVFDKRFLSQPMNSLEHNLDSTDYDMLSMKLINNDLDRTETVCLSSFGRLCFMSFDQTHKTHSIVGHSGELVNPTSLHMPLQEPSPIEITMKQSDELYGLDIGKELIFARNDIAFSVVQLSQEGDICIRGYEQESDNLKPVRVISQAKAALEQHKSLEFHQSYRRFNSNLTDREIDRSIAVCEAGDSEDFFNILDTSTLLEAEERTMSKRASQKYELMKRKLCKRL